jgi:CheY-like chemotaxis protein
MVKILYVEDDPLVREITIELLEHPERRITAVDSAEAALAEYRAQHFDIVLTDVGLPGMSGMDLTRALVKLNPALPVVIVSGYGFNAASLGLGPQVHSVSKPFDAPQASALIQRLCAR